MDNFLARPKRYVTRVGQLIGQYEKVILALLAVVIVISGTFWYRQFTKGHDGGPTVGGSYVEGILGGEEEIQQIATRLTKVGLFSVEPNGKLKPVLVREWRVNPEKTEYVFVLNSQVDKNEILTVLQNSLELLGPSAVSLNDQDELVVALDEPNPNLPFTLAQPLFDYGPYKLSKATEKTTIFSRNPREGSLQPYLNKVIIHTYATKELLQQALSKRKISGSESNVTAPDRYILQSFELPRYYAVMFNLNKSPFRDGAMRRALIDETAVANTPFTLIVADQEPNKSLAQDLVKRWQAQGANVTLETKPLEEVQEKVGPSRNFQALLTGIDYGSELDPYYVWHSSQIRPPGNNFTGVKSGTVDQQIEAIRASLDLSERSKLIKSLHETLNREGVALFVRQETGSFIAEADVVVPTPWMAQNVIDRYRSIAYWYLK